MKISEYQKKFEELFNFLQAEHGNISEIIIKPNTRIYSPVTNKREALLSCEIKFIDIED